MSWEITLCFNWYFSKLKVCCKSCMVMKNIKRLLNLWERQKKIVFNRFIVSISKMKNSKKKKLCYWMLVFENILCLATNSLSIVWIFHAYKCQPSSEYWRKLVCLKSNSMHIAFFFIKSLFNYFEQSIQSFPRNVIGCLFFGNIIFSNIWVEYT